MEMQNKCSLLIYCVLMLLILACDKEDKTSCFDRIQNGAELGIDCGGPCMPCHCFNGILDGNEECIDCGGDCKPCQNMSGRYFDPIFDTYKTTRYVHYGVGITEPSGNMKPLSYNFYEPDEDSKVIRPLIILIGQTNYAENADGTFFTESIDYLENFLHKGYVVAEIIGIRYWQEMPPLTVEAFDKAALLIQEDIRGAVRYFKRNADFFNLDTSNFWLMGASMGAMAALHAAYIDERDHDILHPDLVEFMKNDPGVNTAYEVDGHNSKVKGVIILSGMILDTRIIDKGEPFLYSVIGIQDAYRPFLCDSVKVNWIQEKHYFCGPEAMQDRMELEGFQEENYHFAWIENPPADHMAPFDINQCPECADAITLFIAQRLGYCPEEL
jgi:hypothetical protein